MVFKYSGKIVLNHVFLFVERHVALDITSDLNIENILHLPFDLESPIIPCLSTQCASTLSAILLNSLFFRGFWLGINKLLSLSSFSFAR